MDVNIKDSSFITTLFDSEINFFLKIKLVRKVIPINDAYAEIIMSSLKFSARYDENKSKNIENNRKNSSIRIK